METNNKLLIYQVLPRLFGNDNQTNKPNGDISENGSGKLSDFSAEVLKGIKETGFTHIWYTGLLEHATQTDYSKYGIRKDHPSVVKGKAGSPYAIKDYYDIDPDLADKPEERMKEFKALVARTHKARLKLIIDFVPNHVAREYHSDSKPKKVSDLGENDDLHTSFAPNNNFYYMPGQAFAPDFPLEADDASVYSEFPAKATGNDCFSPHPGRNDWYETVKLNYGVDYLNGQHSYFDPIPDTWHKMLEILLFWAKQKVDGFRCDMAEMVPVEFWEWAISRVKETYPKVIFVAEVYNPDQYRHYIHRGKFDYLYDKVGMYDTLKAVVSGHCPAHRITQAWQAIDDIRDQMLNFLENHDEQRIASPFFAGDAQKAIPAMFVSSMLGTSPFMIYFGQEVGESGMDEEGFSGLDGRTTIFDYWSIESVRNNRAGKLSKQQQAIKQQYSAILRLCAESKAIKYGLFYDLMYVNFNRPAFNPDKQFAFLRYHDGEMLLIVANFDSSGQELSILLPDHAFEYLGIHIVPDEKLKKTEGGYECTVSIKAYNGAVVRLKAIK